MSSPKKKLPPTWLTVTHTTSNLCSNHPHYPPIYQDLLTDPHHHVPDAISSSTTTATSSSGAIQDYNWTFGAVNEHHWTANGDRKSTLVSARCSRSRRRYGRRIGREISDLRWRRLLRQCGQLGIRRVPNRAIVRRVPCLRWRFGGCHSDKGMGHNNNLDRHIMTNKENCNVREGVKPGLGRGCIAITIVFLATIFSSQLKYIITSYSCLLNAKRAIWMGRRDTRFSN